jgi:hypothetical protein
LGESFHGRNEVLGHRELLTLLADRRFTSPKHLNGIRPDTPRGRELIRLRGVIPACGKRASGTGCFRRRPGILMVGGAKHGPGGFELAVLGGLAIADDLAVGTYAPILAAPTVSAVVQKRLGVSVARELRATGQTGPQPPPSRQQEGTPHYGNPDQNQSADEQPDSIGPQAQHAATDERQRH